eukprot:g784.t1
MYARLAKVSAQQRELAKKTKELTGGDASADHDERDAFYEDLADTSIKPHIEDYSRPTQAFLAAGLFLRVVCKNIAFDACVNLAIITAGILVGISFYPSLENSETLNTLEWVVLAIFTAELTCKILMDPLQPWRFFVGKDWQWNLFDFIIVFVSMPGVDTFFKFAGEFPMALRILRIARLLKLLSHHRQLRIILAGLLGGIRSSSFIILLLMIIYYMFAVAGLMFFQENDPREFGDFVQTFVTLFRMSTLEDWTDVMYINMYGCTRYAVGGGIDYWTARTGAVDERAAGYFVDSSKPWTTECHEHAQYGLTYLVSTLFIFITALIVLSMFVGSVAISMSNIRQQIEEIEKAKSIKLKNRRSHHESGHGARGLAPDACLRVQQVAQLPTSGRMRVAKLHELLCRASGKKFERGKHTFFAKEYKAMSGRVCCRWPKQLWFRFAMTVKTSIVETPWFNALVALTILIAGVLVGLQTDGVLKDGEAPAVDHGEQALWTKPHVHMLGYSEVFITTVFILEIVLKMTAEVFEPWNYFRNRWNCFDFIIVAVGLLEVGGGAALVMRMLRLLRVLKLFRALPQLQVLVETLEQATTSIFWIGVLLLLFFYIAAIAAIMLFRENDPWHFGNIHLSLMSLFRITTLEDWTDIMYINERGCDRFEAFPYAYYEHECVSPRGRGILSLIFFMVFVSFGQYVLLSLFIGIISAEIEASVSRQRDGKKQKRLAMAFAKENLGRHWRSRCKLYERAHKLLLEMRPQGITVELLQLALELTGETPHDLVEVASHDPEGTADADAEDGDGGGDSGGGGDGGEGEGEGEGAGAGRHSADAGAGGGSGGSSGSEGDSERVRYSAELNSWFVKVLDRNQGKAAAGGGSNDDDDDGGEHRMTVTGLIYFFEKMPWRSERPGKFKPQDVAWWRPASVTKGDIRRCLCGRSHDSTVRTLSRWQQQQAEVDAAPCCCKPLVRWGCVMRVIVSSWWFESGVLLVVVLSGVLVGAQIGYQIESPLCDNLEVLIFVIFAIEALSKIMCHPIKPWLYFIGPERYWNCFDFALVVVSSPGLGLNMLMLLRLLRLLRLLKFVQHLPKLKVICRGLLGGMKSAVFVCVLMFVIFYIYAVVGVTLFQANDPWHFGNIPLAFETLFRCASLEDWTDVWYTNYYGCAYYHNDIYTTNATVAALRTSFPQMHLCKDNALPVTATAYFISFVVIASFVLLSMFIAAILVSTTEAVFDIEAETLALKRKQRLQLKVDAAGAVDTLKQRTRRQLVLRLVLGAWAAADPEVDADGGRPNGKQAAAGARSSLERVLAGAVSKNLAVSLKVNLDWEEAKKLMPLSRGYFLMAQQMTKLKNNWVFVLLINVCIVLAALLVGSQARCADEECRDHFTFWDNLLSVIFAIEVVIKFTSGGLEPMVYFTGSERNWNMLDLTIVICSFLPAIGSAALVIRMVRLLRVFRVVRIVPELRMLVLALTKSGEAIMYTTVLLFLFFYVNAIYAIMFFRENDPFHWANLHTALMSVLRVTTGDDWTDIMYTAQYGCKSYPVPLTFHCTELPYGGTNCTSTGFYECTDAGNQAFGVPAVLFFVVLFMMGGLVFLNLFIGVVTAGMADAMEQQMGEASSDFAVQKLMRTRRVEQPGGWRKRYRTVEQPGGTLNERQLAMYEEAFSAVASFECESEDDVRKLDRADFRWLVTLLQPGCDAAQLAAVEAEAMAEVERARREDSGGGDGADESDDDDDLDAATSGKASNKLHHGYLHCHDEYWGRWKKKYFVLTDESIRWGSKDKGKAGKISISDEIKFEEFDCREARVVTVRQGEEKLKLKGKVQIELWEKVDGRSARVLHLAAPSEDEAQAWVAEIEKLLVDHKEKQMQELLGVRKEKKHVEYHLCDFIRLCEHPALKRAFADGGKGPKKQAAIWESTDEESANAAAAAEPVDAVAALESEPIKERNSRRSKASGVAGKLASRNVRTVV